MVIAQILQSSRVQKRGRLESHRRQNYVIGINEFHDHKEYKLDKFRKHRFNEQMEEV